MTVYNGLEGDPFFAGPDEPSPALAGADNRTFPGAYHNDLRVGSAEVDAYLPFLLRYGQAGPGADRHGAAEASAIEQAQPNGLYGTLCGVSALTGCSRAAARTRRPSRAPSAPPRRRAPTRASACSAVSQVSRPKETGTPVSIPAS